MLLLGRMPKGGGYWWDFAMALGFGGLAVMGLQSALTARFRRATAPFGVDIIYYFHRLVAIAGFGLVVAHYVIRGRLTSDVFPAGPDATRNPLPPSHRSTSPLLRWRSPALRLSPPAVPAPQR